MRTPRRLAAAGPLAWARLLLVVLARAYRAGLLVLAAVAAAPLLLSWSSFVIESGSMEPSIAVGDVVVAKPVEAEHRVHVGRVYVFADPARADRLLVHRVVERRDDGGFTTAGDANEVTDSTPLEPSSIRAQGILLAPYVGLPVHWVHTGQWSRLALFLMFTCAAFTLATRTCDGSRPTGRGRRSGAAAAVALAVATTSTAGTAGAGFTDTTANGSSKWTAGTWMHPYVAAVSADRPFGFWLLDEPAGSAYGLDRSGNDHTAQFYDSLTLGQPGALPNNPGTAMRLSGGRAVLGNNPTPAPAAYSLELWFRSTSASGGYVAGFENDRDGSGWKATADRILQLEPSGRLTFGAWDSYKTSITTPAAYNDGRWHHVVVTTTSGRLSTIYVDGSPVTSGPTSPVSTYFGFWRLGQGTVGPGTNHTSSFPGEIDNVSVFHSVLSPSRVAAHWVAR
ncbi:signal peptidase I [Nocardioides seonyuensis]|uniref:signal peptidase I n=1 Tax=Nocardioides seonyuensis TaxID=2518371 RepID=UPI001420ADE7|nr:signal peptidase I [Nocardioides seonyuensis]